MPPLFCHRIPKAFLVENVQKGKKSWCNQVNKENGPLLNV